jgi:hypothetical protein
LPEYHKSMTSPLTLIAGSLHRVAGDDLRGAAAHLIPQTCRTRWELVSGQDIQRWMVWLPGRYSDSYASNQDPDPMARRTTFCGP